MKKEGSNYYLVIHTDKYTGNFERECIAYCFGILQESQMYHSLSFQKAFWNNFANEDINTYDEYLEYIEKEKKEDTAISKIFNDIANLPNDGDDKTKEIQENAKRISKMFEIKDEISPLYTEYLKYIYQTVDDIEEDTFYNIDRYYGDTSGECNSIYVQLDKPLNEKYEKLIISRIKDFFNYDIYSKVKDYDYICHFGEPVGSSKPISLLGLELIDMDNNLVKKYV